MVRDFQDVPTLKGKKCQLQVENAQSLPLLQTIWLVLIIIHLLILLSRMIAF